MILVSSSALCVCLSPGNAYFRTGMELAGLHGIDEAIQGTTAPAEQLRACLHELQQGRWQTTGDFLRHYPKATYTGVQEFRIRVYPGMFLDVQCNFPLNLCRIIRIA